MAGRGNRSQGNPTAILMLNQASKNADVLTRLKTNSSVNSISGCDVLKQIFDHFDKSNAEILKTKIAAYLQNHPWYLPLITSKEEPRINLWLNGMINQVQQ